MDFDPRSVVREAIIQRVQCGDVGLAHPVAVDTATSAFTDWAERSWSWTVEPQGVVLVPDVMRVLDLTTANPGRATFDSTSGPRARC